MEGEEYQHIQNVIQSTQINLNDLEKESIKKSTNLNKSYIILCKQSIEDIEKNCNPKDRLEAGIAIELIINHMAFSITGWKAWCNLKGMNIISNKEFKELIPKLTKLSIKWIEIDKKITESKTKELEEELKILEKMEPAKKSKNPLIS